MSNRVTKRNQTGTIKCYGYASLLGKLLVPSHSMGNATKIASGQKRVRDFSKLAIRIATCNVVPKYPCPLQLYSEMDGQREKVR